MDKKIILLFFFSLCFSQVNFAQSSKYDIGISVKKLFMDYQSQNGGSFGEFRSYHHGFEIGFHKQLMDQLNLVVPLKIGAVTSHAENARDNCFHKTVYGLDAQLQYIFNQGTNKKVIPYAMTGIGGVYEVDGETNPQVPIGVGAFFYIADNAYINWQSEYRLSFSENRNNLHHGIGFVYQFGKKDMMEEEPEEEEEVMEEEEEKDSDGDGIPDDQDLCPQKKGEKENNGCPDRDGDGIPDYKDDCPSYAGLKIFRGCPDTDGDGISDNDDECPNMAGPKENNGCPNNDRDNDGVPDELDQCPDVAGDPANSGCPDKDSDKDGVPDNIDKCPNQFGVASANGCPDRDNDGVGDSFDKCPSVAGLKAYDGCPDTDGDGIDDSRDNCPQTAGPVDNNGCPKIQQADKQVLELAMRAVQFDTGKATIQKDSYSVLTQIADIMRKYPDFDLSIEGHTDNVGNANNNKSLSERRAKACYEYLTRQGVASQRLRYYGYGEERPIADNNLLSGRALNRRVEFNLTPSR